MTGWELFAVTLCCVGALSVFGLFCAMRDGARLQCEDHERRRHALKAGWDALRRRRRRIAAKEEDGLYECKNSEDT